MPERSFGRTVRYRRTKLGLSQPQLAELVGRSASTVRSWEADRSVPKEPKVLFVLAAILGIDERTLFDKAGVERPVAVETSPTIEQALASLAPEEPDEEPDDGQTGAGPAGENDRPDRESPMKVVERATVDPVRTADTVTTLTAIPVQELSYVEDPVEKQIYRVRTLAAVVALVAMAIVLIWALGQSLDGLGEWWAELVSNLRL